MFADAAQDALSVVGSGVRAAFVKRGRYRVTYMVDLSSRQALSGPLSLSLAANALAGEHKSLF